MHTLLGREAPFPYLCSPKSVLADFLRPGAYPVEKKTTGIYWVIEYKSASDFNAKLNIQLHRDEQVLRHMYTALDKYAVEYNDKKKNGVPTGKQLKTEA